MALAQQAAMDMQVLGMTMGSQVGAQMQKLNAGGDPAESSVTRNARERTSNATKPKEG